jgi:cell filamentation protein
MIDATDFTIPGTGVLRNKLGITDSAALLKATTDSTVLRLAELHASPIRGGFDSAHLPEPSRAPNGMRKRGWLTS